MLVLKTSMILFEVASSYYRVTEVAAKLLAHQTRVVLITIEAIQGLLFTHACLCSQGEWRPDHVALKTSTFLLL